MYDLSQSISEIAIAGDTKNMVSEQNEAFGFNRNRIGTARLIFHKFEMETILSNNEDF